MNPPFSLALEFAERALAEARRGVAMLVRTGWIETAERYRLFCRHEPTLVAVFAERVPMVEFRWDPEASSATSYAWFVWERDSEGLFPPAKEGVPVFPTVIIPPVCRDTLLFRHDLRLARAEDRSLFDGGA